MRRKIRTMFVMGSIALLLVMIGVMADTESTTVTWVIPTQIDHSISYGGACSSANFYFVENDASIDGTQAKINLTSDNAGANSCQNGTNPGMIISNLGSVTINVTTNMSTSLPAGTGLKASTAWAGYEATCSGTCNVTCCVDIIHGEGVLLVESLTAQTGTEEIWLWANTTNFNSGVAGSDTETLQTTAIQG